jgi:hypothetical protein
VIVLVGNITPHPFTNQLPNPKTDCDNFPI